jgi:CRISPR/Cas system-associated exonuclease Cas4 (RecB family)
VLLGIEVHEAIEALLKGRPLPELSNEAKGLVSAFRDKIAPTLPQPIRSEVPFVVKINGERISGVIDYIAGAEIHDLKTTDGTSFRASHHSLQLTLYALAYRALYGADPERLVIDRLDRKGLVKSYEVKPNHEEVSEVIEVVASGIRRHDWEPTGLLSGACEWCPVKAHCSYWKEANQ